MPTRGLQLAPILWERACSRRGEYIRRILSGGNAVFVSKLTPTGAVFTGRRRVRGQHKQPSFWGVLSDAFPAKAGPTTCTQSHRELGPRAVVIFGPLLLRYQLLFEPRDLLGHSHR